MVPSTGVNFTVSIFPQLAPVNVSEPPTTGIDPPPPFPLVTWGPSVYVTVLPGFPYVFDVAKST